MFDNIFDLSNMYFKDSMIMFIINLFFLYLLIRVIYLKYTKKEMFLFAFFLIGIIVFFISSILNAVQIQVELAVGLVAIFTILRLRTRSINMKDMSYIFAVIGISVINSLRLVAFPLAGRLIINIIIILTAYILEEFLAKNKSDSYRIIYENMELLRPEKQQELTGDVTALTGKKIFRIKILNVDYKKKCAELEIFYRE